MRAVGNSSCIRRVPGGYEISVLPARPDITEQLFGNTLEGAAYAVVVCTRVPVIESGRRPTIAAVTAHGIVVGSGDCGEVGEGEYGQNNFFVPWVQIVYISQRVVVASATLDDEER
jgi:hypothetical protein